jgi:hypothetical protein
MPGERQDDQVAVGDGALDDTLEEVAEELRRPHHDEEARRRQKKDAPEAGTPEPGEGDGPGVLPR